MAKSNRYVGRAGQEIVKCLQYTPEQLEKCAHKVLCAFDNERIHKTKPLDVYSVIERILDVPYDWKYLSPDQSILGVTAFNEGYLWVWPEPFFYDGQKPYQIKVEKGTILIESSLTESGNIGRENFTVMHEVFHNILHEEFFLSQPPNYAHITWNQEYKNNGHKKLLTPLEIIEYQANHCAACFLMPRDLVINVFDRIFVKEHYRKNNAMYLDYVIHSLASEFSVSDQAMKYRLNNLNVIRKSNNDTYVPVRL